MLKKISPFIFSIHSVTGETLGTGHFANVYKGIWSIREGKLYVAAKTLKPNAPYDEEVKFLQEAVITGQFMHPHIVQLHGVVTLGKPVGYNAGHLVLALFGGHRVCLFSFFFHS